MRHILIRYTNDFLKSGGSKSSADGIYFLPHLPKIIVSVENRKRVDPSARLGELGFDLQTVMLSRQRLRY